MTEGFKPSTASNIYADHGIDPKDVAAIANHLNIHSRNKQYSPGDTQKIVAFAQQAKAQQITIPQAIAQAQPQSVDTCPDLSDGQNQTDSDPIADFFTQSQAQARETYGNRASDTALNLRQQAEQMAAPVLVARNLTAAAIVAQGSEAITDPALRSQVEKSQQILMSALTVGASQYSVKNLLRATGLPAFRQLPSMKEVPQLPSA